jgi:hypothetical protein
MLKVLLHGALADAQAVSHRARGQPESDQFQHSKLAGGQHSQVVAQAQGSDTFQPPAQTGN